MGKLQQAGVLGGLANSVSRESHAKTYVNIREHTGLPVRLLLVVLNGPARDALSRCYLAHKVGASTLIAGGTYLRTFR